MRHQISMAVSALALTAALGACGGSDEPAAADSDAAGTGGTSTVSPSDDPDPPQDPPGGVPSEVEPPAGTPTLFYLDFLSGWVVRLGADGSGWSLLVDSGSHAPDGIDVDVENGFIYWTNMGQNTQNDGFVLRSNLDGSNVTTIVPPGATHTPKQIKLDEENQKLYWSDREGARVQRANVDGSGLETLVTIATGQAAVVDETNHCVGMAIDLEGGYFYWTQKGPYGGGVGTIKRAGLHMPAGESHDSRSDIEVLFEGLVTPIDLDLDVAGGYIYWTDNIEGTVNRAPIEVPATSTPATRTDKEILVSDLGLVVGLSLDLYRGQIYFAGTGRVGRANLDGTQAVDLWRGTNEALTGLVFTHVP